MPFHFRGKSFTNKSTMELLEKRRESNTQGQLFDKEILDGWFRLNSESIDNFVLGDNRVKEDETLI